MKSKQLLIYVIMLCIALCAMFFIKQKNTQKKPRDYEEIKSEGILRIVMEYNQSDYYFKNDTTNGFQYELCQAMSKIAGIEFQLFLEMSLSESFSDLNKQKYDVIAQNIPTTSELKENFLLSEPIVKNKQVLIQRTQKANNDIKPIRNQLQLAKKTLYITKDSPVLVRLQNLQHEIGDTIFINEEKIYSSEQLIIMVAKGDIDFAVCDYQIAKKAKKEFPEIDIETDICFTQLQSWAVRKNSPVLLDSINSWISTLRESGIYDKIYKKYYK